MLSGRKGVIRRAILALTMWNGPARTFLLKCRVWTVRSYVRPVSAVDMTAGHDEIRNANRLINFARS
jgi:hypothetical protein